MFKSVAVFFLFSLTSHSAVKFHDNRACAEDHIKFCPSDTVRTTAWFDCMAKHSAELKPACKAVVAKGAEKPSAKKPSCDGDFAKFCPQAGKDAHARADCLFNHREELSSSCRDSFPQPSPSN